MPMIIAAERKGELMIQIEESNPSFESCGKCIHYDDSEEMCILRQCIHAVSQLKECYVPSKKGKWIEQDDSWDGVYYECSACGEPWTTIDGTPWDNGMNFCPNCGADMTEGEG